jgi:hypothetical protein
MTNYQPLRDALRAVPSHYSEFVNGKRSMNKRAMRWAFAFGVPAEALLQALPFLGSSDIDRRLASLRAQTTTKAPK